VILDERCAGFFAIGAAQASHAPVAVLCTSGSAAADLHPAVVEADEAAVPLIVLTADRPPELRGIGAGQTIDQLKLYGSAVRWFCEVGTHDADDAGLLQFRSVACRAFAAARGEPRPGPVHLNVPWREPLSPAPAAGAVTATKSLALEGRDGRPLTAVVPPTGSPSSALIDALAERVRSKPRGAIVVGRQTDPELGPALAALAEATGYPILPEPTSQVRMGSHDRSRVAWSYDSIARAEPGWLLPEQVLRFGEMPTSKSLRQWLADNQVDQICVVPHGWNEPTLIGAAMVRADPVAVARDLRELLAEHSGPDEDWLRSWTRADAGAAAAIEEELGADTEPTEPSIHAQLGRLYASGDVVYTASSMPIRDQEAFVAAGPADVTFLCNRGTNGIDGLVSSGAGAATASGRPTWIVTGDLGLVYDATGLGAIRGSGVPVRVVVINNEGSGIFEFLPHAEQVEREEFEALFGTPSPIEPKKLAAIHGLPYKQIKRVGDLEAASSEAGMIEIRTARKPNVEVHRRIAKRVADSIGDAGSSG
jgi:2-succinyl-5-enolpyruvyl-6-hydroxy-3-cyclohexene-1-carboxylate synthase